MYAVKIRVSGNLSEMLTRGCGSVVRTLKGDICAFRSLAAAQEVAKFWLGMAFLVDFHRQTEKPIVKHSALSSLNPKSLH